MSRDRSLEVLIRNGLSETAVAELIAILDSKESSIEKWQKIMPTITSFKPGMQFEIYKMIYPDWEQLPAPTYLPKNDSTLHINELMQRLKIPSYDEFHQWSVKSYQDFWRLMIEQLNIKFINPFKELVDLSQGYEKPKWLKGATLNILESCFRADPSAIALVTQNEAGEMAKLTYQELDLLSNQVANSLMPIQQGSKIAIIMPMTALAVAIYCGIIKAGCVAVGIPDSFSSKEIALRLSIVDCQKVFCQSHLFRDGKLLPLYERIVEAGAPETIVMTRMKNIELRTQDKDWYEFLSTNQKFKIVECKPSDAITILFSSGTTATPKAIPWQHTTPIKCASDAYLHHDLHNSDVFCWPTNLGWMMGPWLIFACLINKATIALFDGSPNHSKFIEFIENAKVTHLGVVPTIVKAWRKSKLLENHNLKNIKLFTSTGERSNIEDMFYLMAIASFKPVIEYCGGTEIGGAYITSTLLQPIAPAAFTTKALGLDFIILNENGEPSERGEVAIIPPSIGLSTELLNKDHHENYFANMPCYQNIPLRRHGDELIHYKNGFYKLLGRTDDTMKLSGIKVSAAEIENVVNLLPGIEESAAVAINPDHGGPSLLVIFVVLEANKQLDNEIKLSIQSAIKTSLNPLFKIHDIVAINELPRTASNKMMRRSLRDYYFQNI